MKYPYTWNLVATVFMGNGSVQAKFLTLFPQKVMSKEKCGENRQPQDLSSQGHTALTRACPSVYVVHGRHRGDAGDTVSPTFWFRRCLCLLYFQSLLSFTGHMHVRVTMLSVMLQTSSHASQKNPVSTEKEVFHRTSLFTDKQSTRSV